MAEDTAESSANIDSTTPDWNASATVFAPIAPSSTSSATASGLRFHTVTSKPAPSRFRAMGRPIAPKPTTETEVMDFPLESAEPSKTVQDSHTVNEAGADQSARDVFRLDNDTLAFRFTATLTNRNGSRFERLTSPQRLELWLRANDLMGAPATATEDDLRGAQDLREAIHRIGTAVCENRRASRTDVGIVNTASELGDAHLVLESGRALWKSAGDNPIRDALSIVAADAIAVLGGADRDRSRQQPTLVLDEHLRKQSQEIRDDRSRRLAHLTFTATPFRRHSVPQLLDRRRQQEKKQREVRRHRNEHTDEQRHHHDQESDDFSGEMRLRILFAQRRVADQTPRDHRQARSTGCHCPDVESPGPEILRRRCNERCREGQEHDGHHPQPQSANDHLVRVDHKTKQPMLRPPEPEDHQKAQGERVELRSVIAQQFRRGAVVVTGEFDQRQYEQRDRNGDNRVDESDVALEVAVPINASTNTQSDRVPLTANRGIAVFSIGVMGFITANLIPLMIVAMVEDLGVTESAAGAVLTASLLVCAVTCLATTRIASGRHRHLLGRVSLIAMAAAFGVAAIAPSTTIACAAIIVGGIGAGGSASVGGAALAALTNPDRASSISGLVNRVVVTAVLALIPILGTHMTNAFGIVAVLALATAATVTWLPSSPVKESPETAKSANTTTALPAGVSAKRLTFAGTAFLAMLAIWAISEDSLWAVLGIMGSEHAGLSDQQMSLALSASTAGGVLAAVTLTALGSRLSAGLTTDPTIYLVVVIAWNTIYAATFIVLVAISAALDAAGRWSAPLLGTYLIGSAFAPLFGTSVTAGLGYPTFGVIISGISFVLLVPFALVSRLSARTEEVMNDSITHYRNGKIFTAADDGWAESIVVEGHKLRFVGETVYADILAPDAEVIDLEGAVVLPGFVDAHTHLVMMGFALQKLDLRDAADLADIQSSIKQFAESNPDAPRLLGRSWLFSALDGGHPTREMIDAVVPDRPVYLDANDVHSVWVNTAALRELGIDADTPDPIGGRIGRDPDTGEATGMLYETAMMLYVWPKLAELASD
ncbi:hypothetical protein ST47_g1259 [Ascochyta rabiei]|uniref:Amidohydrolase 3 domain-containing protein n=1 Tax=Didymella rabiei TaxID=5454 RepID=A0A163L6P4_DIDRA|nr:hypothetical protein ST47_g1259 [Ascochyta rabiei]